ncbi:MAG: B12-binding domain-containing protein [Clostridiaceae bacterium]
MASMEEIYEKFSGYLESEDKQKCVEYILDILNSGQISIADLYEKILAPSLDNMPPSEEELYIWREHVRSSIIRTVIECCYPHVLKLIKESGQRMDKGKVILVCPPDEYHELGIRVGSDFFNICGYSTILVGANTPPEVLLRGLVSENPKYIAISVSNYYNLFAAKKIADEISAVNKSVIILACGNTFLKDRSLSRKVGAKGVVNSIEDIRALEEEL